MLWVPPVVDRLGSRATSLGLPSWIVEIGGGLAGLVLVGLAATLALEVRPAAMPDRIAEAAEGAPNDGSRKEGEEAGDGEGVDFDEETRRRLEALGYL